MTESRTKPGVAFWLAAVLIAVLASGVTFGLLIGNGTIVRHPDAALRFSLANGTTMSGAALQERAAQASGDAPVALLHLEAVKFAHGGTTISMKWRFIGSTAAGDSYEFEITDSGRGPMKKRVEFAGVPVELLKSGDVVVTIEPKILSPE